MPSEVSFVTNSGGKLAHQNMLVAIKNLATANGWTQLRFDDTVTNHELILRGPGMGGGEQIFVGFRCYQDGPSDYYNLAVAGFTGYVSGNSFDTQPGALLSGIPAHNSRIDYWLTVNGQRIALAMKVGTPVYESAYVGLGLRQGTPSQYPYPLVVGGMLNGVPSTRFSDSAHSLPYKGSRANLRLRWLDGTWIQPETWPWDCQALMVDNGSGTTQAQLRDTNNSYPVLPVLLLSSSGLLVELDGVGYITGFGNGVENTLSIDGKTWVVIQDAARTGFADYYAMRMD